MNQLDSNLGGIHQLPSDCYPPTDSDDESFVVLDRSLAPDMIDDLERKHFEVLSPEVIDRSIEVATDLLADIASLSPAPAMPTLEQPDMACSINTISSALSFDEIQRKVDSLIEENGKLKSTLHQNNLVMKNQYDTLIQWQTDVDRVQESHKKKFEDTKEYIKELQKENGRLVEMFRQQQGKSAPQSFMNVEDPALSKTIEDQALMITSLQKELIECNANLDKATQALIEAQQAVKKQLSDKELEFDTKKQGLLERITALKVVNEKLVGNQAIAEDVEKLRSQLMAAQVALTDLKQAKRATDAELEAKDREIKKLESLLIKMDENTERTEVLEQQLLVYQSDFETERDCKNKAIIDKNQLMDDLQKVQRRNHELLEEVESLRAKCTFVEVTGKAPSAPPRPAARQPSPYACPRCSFGFTSYVALENHVYRCIELDALP